MSFNVLSNYVLLWAESKGLLKEENAHKQMLKVLEEVGETSAALLRGDKELIKDGIGDSFVTLIILSKQLGFDPEECLAAAYDEIKDREGKTENGIFIKEDK